MAAFAHGSTSAHSQTRWCLRRALGFFGALGATRRRKDKSATPSAASQPRLGDRGAVRQPQQSSSSLSLLPPDPAPPPVLLPPFPLADDPPVPLPPVPLPPVPLDPPGPSPRGPYSGGAEPIS